MKEKLDRLIQCFYKERSRLASVILVRPEVWDEIVEEMLMFGSPEGLVPDTEETESVSHFSYRGLPVYRSSDVDGDIVIF